MKPFLLVSSRPEEEALDSEYQAYLRATGLDADQLELAEFDLVGLPPIEPEQYAGIFVAGSPYGGAGDRGYISQRTSWVREELEALLKQLLEADASLLVTGSAIAILTRILGGKVSGENAEYGDIIDVERTRDAREDPVMAGIPEVFLAYVNHSEAIDELPEEAVRLAWSLNTPVQVYRWKDNVYAVQFNPELDADAINVQIQGFADAGDSGFGDPESLVTRGRHGDGSHAAGQILANFVKVVRG